MKLAFVVFFSTLILLSGCDEEVNRPVILMHQVSELNEEGVTLSAKISVIGDVQATNYGFVWASHSEPVITDSAHSFNASPVPGNFSVRLTDDLITDNLYYARAFVQTSKEIYYSSKVKFQSLGSATPKISDFNPKHGTAGEKVIITGQHFSENIDNIEVFVGELPCKVVSPGRTQLTVEMPPSYVTGTYPISVKINDKTAESSAKFTLDGPIIEMITPSSGPAFTPLTINGSGFSETPTDNEVYIGTFKVAVASASSNQITFLVPQLNTAGPKEISVKIKHATAISPLPFNLTGPKITSLSPMSGVQGSEIIITGEGFSSVPSENSVVFGLHSGANVISATPTQLVVVLPVMMEAGDVSVSVTVKNIQTFSDSPFTVEGPEVTSITPLEQYRGRPITIFGKNFDASGDTKVYFQNKQAVLLDYSTTSLTVEVPYDLSTSSAVTIYVGAIKYQSTQILRLLTPWQKQTDFPGQKRYGASSFSLGGYGYVCMGYNSGQNMRDVWRFDPTNNSWTRMKDHPGPTRSYAFSFVANGKAYMGGGGHSTGSGNSTNYYDLWEYDPSNDTWTQKQSFSPNGITNARLTATGIGNYGYFAYNNRLYRYDTDQDKWITLDSFPWAHNGAMTAITVGDKGYFGLGFLNNTFWEYTPSTNTWAQLPDLPGPSSVSHPHAFVFGNKLYVGSSTLFYEFDVLTKEWRRVAGMPEEAGYVGMFTIGDRGYVATGLNGGALNFFYSFNPDY